MAIISFSLVKVSPNKYKYVSTCEEIYTTYRQLSCNFTSSLSRLNNRYPTCSEWMDHGELDEVWVAVNASLDMRKPEEIYAMLSLVYGVAAFLGLIVHVIGVEVYLDRTKQENERLSEVARRRRRETGPER